ncbi:MAG: hypothetical protein RL701_8180 [Pseudomonadota bacterium]|jgi:DNA-binding response OmpR family regulator
MYEPHNDPSVRTQLSKYTLCIVISDNRETADGLHSYLTNAGIRTRTARRLRDVTAICKDSAALVLFPDEYDDSEVVSNLRGLRAAHPHLLLLLVTAKPQRVRAACEPDARSVLPVVMPKPAFCWSLLDAIRAHVQRETP